MEELKENVACVVALAGILERMEPGNTAQIADLALKANSLLKHANLAWGRVLGSAPGVDSVKLAKIMGLMGSNNAFERTLAAEQAISLVKKANTSWRVLLVAQSSHGSQGLAGSDSSHTSNYASGASNYAPEASDTKKLYASMVVNAKLGKFWWKDRSSKRAFWVANGRDCFVLHAKNDIKSSVIKLSQTELDRFFELYTRQLNLCVLLKTRAMEQFFQTHVQQIRADIECLEKQEGFKEARSGVSDAVMGIAWAFSKRKRYFSGDEYNVVHLATGLCFWIANEERFFESYVSKEENAPKYPLNAQERKFLWQAYTGIWFKEKKTWWKIW